MEIKYQPKIKTHLIVFLIFCFLGFPLIALNFSLFFLDFRGGVFGKLAVVVLWLLTLMTPYYAVKKYPINWWFPGVSIVVPAIAIIIYDLLVGSASMIVLIFPILFVLIFALPAGWLGMLQKERKKNR